MLESMQTRELVPLNRADQVAVLRALADILPLDGIIFDENGRGFHSDTYCDYDRSGGELHAEVLSMRNNKVLVKLRRAPCARRHGRQQNRTYLFVVANCDGEWEMMGQPAPFDHSSIPA